KSPRTAPLLDEDDVRAILPNRGGGVWVGFKGWGSAFLRAGERGLTYVGLSNPGFSSVSHLREGSDGWAWAATSSGIARFKDGRAMVLDERDGLPCSGAEWTIEDDDRALWILQVCGLIRIDHSEWEAWAASDAHRKVRWTMLTGEDGV